MAHNQVENAFLGRAIQELQPQYERIYGKYNGNFYIGNGIKFSVLPGGKLTIAKLVDGEFVPDPKIQPVDCYNLIKPHEDLATAVQRVFYQRL